MLINITFFILQSLSQFSIFTYAEVLTNWKTEQTMTETKATDKTNETLFPARNTLICSKLQFAGDHCQY